MSDPETILSSRAAEPVGPYSHARRVGELLFLAGIGPRRRGDTEIPGVRLDAQGEILSYDFEAQCRSALENVRVILEDAGSGLSQVVDVTVFLTNLKDDFPVLNRVYAEVFGSNRPARTTVEVSRLPTPIAVEFKVVAVVGD